MSSEFPKSKTPVAPALTAIDFTVAAVFSVVVTPSIAERYLTVSAQARPLNAGSLDRLVTDIRAGRFVFTADSIKFDRSGYLIDGQVRLAAIIKANVSVELLLATGVSAEARHVIDTGAKFSLKQSLDLDGVKHTGNVAAALMSIQAWERGDHLEDPNPFRGATTNPGSLAFLKANREVEQIAHEASKLSKKIRSLTTKQLALFIWAFDKLDRDDRSDFFAKLVSGANTGATDPVYLLHELLIRNDNAVTKVNSRALTALVIKAWNAYRGNTAMKVLTFTGGGTQPESFPLPR